MEKKQSQQGMKVMNHLVAPLTPEGRSRLGALSMRRQNCVSYKPILPVLMMPFSQCDTPRGFAQWIYDNFGASSDGTQYCIRYWYKKNAWSRRLRRLAMIKLYDLEDGDFRVEYIDMKNISRFKWFDARGAK